MDWTSVAAPSGRADRARAWPRAVSRAVREGRWLPATRLPPIRTVAAELGLSPTTVSAAWSLLAARRDDPHRRPARHDRRRPAARRHAALPARARPQHARSGSTCPPASPTRRCCPTCRARVASLRGAAATPGSYLDDAGRCPNWPTCCAPTGRTHADELTVVDGAMDGLELVTRVLVGFGDRVAVEHPALPAAARPARGARRRPSSAFRSTRAGMSADALARGGPGQRRLPAAARAEPDRRVADGRARGGTGPA